MPSWPIDIDADEDLILQLLHVGWFMRQENLNATETGPTWAEVVEFCVQTVFEHITGESVEEV